MRTRLNEESSALTRRQGLHLLAGLAVAPTLVLSGCGGHEPEPIPDAEHLELGLPSQPGEWQRELQSLADLLMAYHPRPFAHLARERFLEQARALMSSLAMATEARAYPGLMRLLSGLRDGHCFLTFPWALAAGPSALPFSVFAFEEGLYITGIEAERPELSPLAGAEVLAYGGRPAAEALKAAASYLPAENPHMALYYGAQALRSGLILADAGLADTPGQARLTLRSRDGALTERVLATGPRQELQSASAAPPTRPSQRPELDFWAEWLGEAVFYLRYRRCRDAAGFESLVREHLSAQRFPSVRRLVVDLRGNSGGDSRVIQPLLEGLRQLGIRGSRIAVLSDRGTLSAAVDAIIDLKQLEAFHAGEAPGQRPNFNGNVRTVSTSSGRLSLNLPTTYQPRVAGDPEQLTPDLVRPLRYADWLAQRDTLLEEVLAG